MGNNILIYNLIHDFSSFNLQISSNEFENNQLYDGNANIQQDQQYNPIFLDFMQNKVLNNTGYKGNAISAQGNIQINIQQNDFIQNEATYGGSLYLQQISSNIKIQKNIFNKNQAFYGGCIYIKSIYSDIIVQNNELILNTAEKEGGAIMLENLIFQQKNQIQITNNTFQQNSALSGGAITLKGWAQPTILQNFIEYNIFQENSAKFQGGVIYIQENFSLKYPFYYLFGQFNVFIKNQAKSGAVVKLANLQRSSDWYLFINESFQNQNEFVENLSQFGENYLINCTQGEFYDQNILGCSPCQLGYFNYDIQKNFYQCQKCPENSICEGNYTGIQIKEKFWIDQNYQETFYCEKYPKACIGGNDFQNQCLQGYEGPICSVLFGIPPQISDYFSTITQLAQGQTSSLSCVLPKLINNNEQLSELIWEYIILIIDFLLVLFFAKVIKLKFLKQIPVNSYINQFMIFLMPAYVDKSDNDYFIFILVTIVNFWYILQMAYYILREIIQEKSIKYEEKIKNNKFLKIFKCLINQKYLNSKIKARKNWKILTNAINSMNNQQLHDLFIKDSKYFSFSQSYSIFFQKQLYQQQKQYANSKVLNFDNNLSKYHDSQDIKDSRISIKYEQQIQPFDQEKLILNQRQQKLLILENELENSKQLQKSQQKRIETQYLKKFNSVILDDQQSQELQRKLSLFSQK
ncbi:Pectin lyase fold/virulence factor [Pseudocohnilembus persalinus]|uniref:Pectin lyase fold/virulence factor n=1 Tax=Pseudocohnilembus persalinus TaxID=266149 RepID=A0A0V0QCC4_PSEPJ|nr:Pectin lyase fold/virulence factor [Pseudocohnilembus persalinus]|eukprot:KRW99877.1 Pectin lyase fold/virulence factor [Pseudocohnilembus persalinus]